QLLLDVEAFRRLDVLQVDAAEGGFQQLTYADDFVGVGGVQFQVENINVGETFKQNSFTFHHRLAGECSNMTESEHRRPIADHRHQVSGGGVLECMAGVRFGSQRWMRYAWSVGAGWLGCSASGRGWGCFRF